MDTKHTTTHQQRTILTIRPVWLKLTISPVIRIPTSRSLDRELHNFLRARAIPSFFNEDTAIPMQQVPSAIARDGAGTGLGN